MESDHNMLQLEKGELQKPEAESSSSSSSSFYFAPPPTTSQASEGQQLGQLTLHLQCDVARWQQMGSSAKVEGPPRRTLLILVVDKSGSMCGPYERQVVPAMLHIMEQSYALAHLDCEIILYNTSATRLQLTQGNYRSTLSPLCAGGGTSFNSAFNQIGKLLTASASKYDDVVVGFLTDGQDSSGKDSREYRALQRLIRELQTPVVVHSLAFTASHDFEFLDSIRRDLGTTEGGFQYAEEGDGPEVLKEKLQAIFESVSVKQPSAELVVSVDGYEFVDDDEVTATSALTTTVQLPLDGSSVEVFGLVRPVRSSSSSYSFSTTTGAEEGEQQQVEVVARLTEYSDVPALRQVFRVPVREQTKADQAYAGLRRVNKRISALQTAIANAVSAGAVKKESLEAWKRTLQDLSKHLAQFQGVPMLRLFKKQLRTSVFEAVNETSGKLNQVLALVTELEKSTHLSTAMKARLAEIAYGHQFQSASRTRRLNTRAGRNASLLAEAEKALNDVQIDPATVNSISDDLAENFRCILTQSNWKELLLEPQDRDVVGFGVALSRPETAVDDPTQVRIVDVSISPVSKSAFDDALAYSIATEGHLQAHGGFALHEADVGVAVRGMGREPINAWVPLFIHPEHWKLVFPQLKGVMGYLATLDPLGYNPNQVDLFYLLLATMVSRLSATPGEKELRLLFAVQRTCIALTRDFPNLTSKLSALLEAFITKPEARLKDQTKNLMVLVGYALSLPGATVDGLLPSSHAWLTFWLHLLQEAVRRTSDSICRSYSEEQVDALLMAIVSASNALPAPQVAAHLFCSRDRPYVEPAASAQTSVGAHGSKQEGAKHDGSSAPSPGEEAAAAAAAAPAKAPAPSTEKEEERRPSGQGIVHDSTVDKAARKLAQQFIYGARDSTAPELVDDRPSFQPTNVSEEMLGTLLQFGKDFNKRGHPSLSAVISLATFTHAWLALQRRAGSTEALLGEIDGNGGVAPDAWVAATKQAFAGRAQQPATFASCFHVLEQVTGDEVRAVAHHDWLLVLRAMVAQGVQLRVNKDCREAIEGGKYLDPVTNTERVLESFFTELLARREKEGQQQQRKAQLQYAIRRCVDTDDLTLFVGFLVSRRGFDGKRNTQAFRELYLQFQHATEASAIPLGAEKLKILLTGKWEMDGTTINVLDGGKAWQPGERRTKKRYRNNVHRFQRVWGAAFTDVVARTSSS